MVQWFKVILAHQSVKVKRKPPCRGPFFEKGYKKTSGDCRQRTGRAPWYHLFLPPPRECGLNGYPAIPSLCNGRTRSGLLTALPSDAVFGGQLGSGSDPPSCAGRSQQLRPSLRAELATVFSVKAILTETLYHRTGELSRTSPRLFASQSMGRKISATRAASPRWSSHAPMRSRCRTESSPHFMAA